MSEFSKFSNLKEDLIMGIPKQGPVIAIDGPAGTGKSSATRRLADVLGFIHVDTGALYRAVAFLSIEKRAEGISLEGVSPDQISEKEYAVACARTVHLEFKRKPNKNPSNRVYANGRDLTDFIRTPEVTIVSSRVSAIPEVRAALLGLQRRLGCVGKAILEGRDIGTVIFPDADIKFFLSATVEERAKRRLIELEAAGADAPSLQEVQALIQERDRGDSTRQIAPLKKAENAIEIDTSSLTLDQVVREMENIARDKLGLKIQL